MSPAFTEIPAQALSEALKKGALALDEPQGFWALAFLRHPLGTGMSCRASGTPPQFSSGLIFAADNMLAVPPADRATVPAEEFLSLFRATAPRPFQGERVARLGSRFLALPSVLYSSNTFQGAHHTFWMSAETMTAVRALMMGQALETTLPAASSPRRFRF